MYLLGGLQHGDGRSPANQRAHLSKYTVAVQIRSCMSLWWMDYRLSSAILLSCVATPEHLRVIIWTIPLANRWYFHPKQCAEMGIVRHIPALLRPAPPAFQRFDQINLCPVVFEIHPNDRRIIMSTFPKI